MPSSSHAVLNLAIALMALPLVVEGLLAMRRRASRARHAGGLALALLLAAVFEWPAARIALRVQHEDVRATPPALPDEVLEKLLTSRRLYDLRRSCSGRLGSEPQAESARELLILAKTARLSGWQGSPLVERAASAAQSNPQLAFLVPFVRRVAGPPSSGWPPAVFAGGTPASAGATPLATFAGLAAYRHGDGCDVLVMFEPSAPLSGARVWLHQYPRGSHEYLDVSLALPPADWNVGNPAWELFRATSAGGATFYAGVATGDSLGPAAELGRADGCAAEEK